MAGTKRAIPAATRRGVAIAAGIIPGGGSQPAYCFWCEAPGSVGWDTLYTSQRPSGWVCLGGLEFDHVVPEHLGGSSGPENVVLACRSCNRRKGHMPLGEWLERINWCQVST